MANPPVPPINLWNYRAVVLYVIWLGIAPLAASLKPKEIPAIHGKETR